MPKVHTHYDNLKVARDAPVEVIEAAYQALAAKYRPDRNPEARAARIWDMVQAAHDILTNPEHRREHDEWIRREEAQAASTLFGLGRLGVTICDRIHWRTALATAILLGLGLWLWHPLLFKESGNVEGIAALESAHGGLSSSVGIASPSPKDIQAVTDQAASSANQVRPLALRPVDFSSGPVAVGPDTPACTPLPVPPTSVLSILYEHGAQQEWPRLVLKVGTFDRNVYAKVMGVDTEPNPREVAVLFIRKGESLDVALPPGRYKVRYVSGNSWFGSEWVRECGSPSASEGDDAIVLSAAEHRRDGTALVDEATVELWQQVGGNFPTHKVPINRF